MLCRSFARIFSISEAENRLLGFAGECWGAESGSVGGTIVVDERDITSAIISLTGAPLVMI